MVSRTIFLNFEEMIKNNRIEEADNRLKKLFEDQAKSKFNEWINARTEDEFIMTMNAIRLQGKYFKDMTLEKYAKQLTKLQDVKTGRTFIDGFDQTFNLDIGSWRFKIVEDSVEYGGCCRYLERVIEIIKMNRNDKFVLLHEMIHAFEWMLSQECETYKQFLLIELYRKLVPKIPNLDKLILIDMHSEFRVHSLLFMFKSLDLDLRLKKTLGYIYDYGRSQLFNNEGLARGDKMI
jgi:hypothetical protein